jgi:YVTN family beta-propeller protein
VTTTVILALCCASAIASAQSAPCTAIYTPPVLVPVTGVLGDIIVDAACEYVYVTNTSQNRVEVFSLQTRTLQTPIQVGSKPIGLDITPDGTRMYVANSGGNNVSVVDLAQRLELRKISFAPGHSSDTAYSIAIASNGRAFFSTTFSGSGFGGRMMQLDLATEQVTQRTDFWFSGSTTEVTQLAASGDRNVIGVVAGDISSGPVFRYTAGTDTFSPERDLDAFVSSVSLDRTGSRLLVTPGAFVLDAALNLSGTISLAAGWGGSAVDPAGTIGYRAVASRIDVLNLSTFLKTGELPLGDTLNQTASYLTSGAMAISGDGRLLAVITDHGFSLVGTSPPAITSVTPGSAQATSLNVLVTGQSTHFAPGQTTADFGPGIIVHGVTVSDATHASVHISVPSDAPVGAHTVVMTTGAEVAVGANLFTVTPGTSITRITPNRGQPGQQDLTVEITAPLAHFSQGVTVASFGPGIMVLRTRVIDANHLAVNLSITAGAALGQRTVSVTSGNELLRLTNGFTVRRLPQQTQTFAYAVGRRRSPSQGAPAGSGTQTVTVIDTTTNAIAALIPTGIGCFCVGADGIAVSPDGASVYVTNEIENSLSVIDAVTNQVTATIPLGAGGPIAVAVSPDSTRVYVVMGSLTTAVKVIDTSTLAVVSSIPLGATQARGIAITPDGGRLYVSKYGGSSVDVIDTSLLTVVATIPVGALPLGVEASADGAFIYVANATSLAGTVPGTVSVISTATNTVVGTVAVGFVPYSAKLTRDGSRAYVVNALSSGVMVIDTATRTLGAPVAGTTFSNAIAFTPDSARGYVATNESIQAIQVVDVATNAVIGTMTAPSGAHGLILSIAMSPGATRVVALAGDLDFGMVPVGGRATRTVTITNPGNSPLAVSSLAFPAGFSASFAGASIAGGGSQQVTVTFAPARAGSHGGTIIAAGDQTSGRATIAVSGYGSTLTTRAGDFDRDTATDMTVYRPSNGGWFILRSGAAFNAGLVYSWGVSTDTPMPGDYDGDGKTDVAVYRPASGHWFILKSTSNYTASDSYQWGTSGDLPVAGDFDGDGRSDIAVFRPSTSAWYVLRSSTGFVGGLGYTWGAAGDVPVPGDYDGDGRTDIAVYRPSTGHWFILQSTTAYSTWATYQWGTAGDAPVQGDYDGDGRTDIAVYRPSSGDWYVLRSSSGFTAGDRYTWGASTDVPVPGDYDGDGRTDIAVYRGSSGHWFILRSSTGYSGSWTYQWGATGDVPVVR